MAKVCRFLQSSTSGALGLVSTCMLLLKLEAPGLRATVALNLDP